MASLRFDSGLRYDAGLHYDAEAGPAPQPPWTGKNKLMNKFKLELSRKSPADKIVLGEAHIDAMAEAGALATYPVASRKPTDAELQTAQDELVASEAAVAAAETMLKTAIQDRDAKEALWDVAITSRANHCESVTPTDLVALASTGLPLRSAPTPVGVLPMPVNLVAKASDFEGQIDLSCDAVNGARTYEWQCRVHTENSTWENVKSTTTRKVSVTGLTPGQQYAFRVRAIGAAGPGPWSDEAVKRVS